jgi:uncharacterized protein
MTATSNPVAEARGSKPAPGAPWWRFGMVWFVFAGPAIVVVAGFTTMFIAYHGADVVLSEGPAEAVTRVATPGPVSKTPALQARDPAATPAP